MSLPRESKIIILIQRGADTPSLHIITHIPLRGAYSIEIEMIASRVCVGLGGRQRLLSSLLHSPVTLGVEKAPLEDLMEGP